MDLNLCRVSLTLIKTTNLKPRTIKSYEKKLEVWENYVGKTATLESIDAQTILDFQLWLAKSDTVTGRVGVSARTIDGYTEVVSNVYKKIIKRLAYNPVEGRLVSKKQRMKSNRKAFTAGELKRIFDPNYLNACTDPVNFFVPILGLLTGSRPASICQLRLGDVEIEEGIYVVRYHDFLVDNSSKTSATNRTTPLHPVLQQIGFLEYLEDVKKLPGANDNTLIFPMLNKYEQGYADVPSQNFTLLLKKLGIYVTNVKVFYSLRHTVNIRMKKRGVTEDIRSQYIGHENDTVNNRSYTDGQTPSQFLLEKAIPALKFDEIEWSKIRYKGDQKQLERRYELAQKRDFKKAKRKASKDLKN